MDQLDWPYCWGDRIPAYREGSIKSIHVGTREGKFKESPDYSCYSADGFVSILHMKEIQPGIKEPTEVRGV